MSTPSISLTVIAGSSGGPAPHHLAVRAADASTCGSGNFSEGFFEWQVVNSDGSALGASDYITATDPADSSTKYLHLDQHGANCHFLKLTAGDIKVKCRYRNRDGVWSSWASTSTISVTARNSSLYAYADGSASGDGTGSSWANACTTFQAGVAAAIAKGAGATLFVRDCNCSGSSSAMSVANVRITKDPSAGTVTVTLTGNYDAVGCGTNTNGVVIDNLTFTTSSAGNGRIVNCSAGQTSTSICLYNVHHGNLDDVTSCQSTGVVKGMSHINVTEDSQIDSQAFICGDCEGFLAWGCAMPLGSTGEHTYRFTNDSATNYYHSFQYCDIGDATTKCAIRWYGYKHLWVHGCKLHRCAAVGRLSPGDPDFGGSVWCFERCWFLQIAGQTTEQQLDVGSGFPYGSVRNCYFDDMDLRFYENGDITSGTVDDMTIIHNTFRNTRDYGVVIYAASLTSNPVRQIIRGNVFKGAPLSTEPWIYVKNVSTTTGWDWDGNVFEGAANRRTLQDQSGPTNYGFTAYAALSWVGTDQLLSAITINTSTMEPTESEILTAAPATAPMPFYSFNGYQYAHTGVSTRAAGAWLDPAVAYVAPTGYRSITINTAGRRMSIRKTA